MNLLRRGIIARVPIVVRDSITIGNDGIDYGYDTAVPFGSLSNNAWIPSGVISVLTVRSMNGGSITFRGNPDGVQYDTATNIEIKLYTSQYDDATLIASGAVSWGGTLYSGSSQGDFYTAMSSNDGNTLGIEIVKVN